jgi:hypothetical protein
MVRPSTARLKVNPPLGLRPSLENCRMADLQVDPAYQRSIDNGPSQALIRKIATFWDWTLFHPLAVARREDGSLWVVDGQHRLAAARLRRDIYDIPCVVSPSLCQADEAASFVAMNQQRRALSKLDLFKAAVTGTDSEAAQIAAALAASGLSLAPHTNHTAWKPGMISNVGGIEQAWRSHGPRIARAALQALAAGLAGQVLRYAGSIFPGIVAVCADEMSDGHPFAPPRWELFIEMIAEGDQAAWRGDIARHRAANPNVKYSAASAAVFRAAWSELLDELEEAA